MKRLAYTVVALLLLVALGSCKGKVVRNAQGQERFVPDVTAEDDDSGNIAPEEVESEEQSEQDDMGNSEPVEEPAVEEPEDENAEDDMSMEDEGEVDQEVVFSPTFEFDQDAFEQLQSFKTTTTMTFVPEDGAAEHTTVETAFIREPLAQYFLFLSDVEEVELISVDDGAWARFNDQWAQIPPDVLEDLVARFTGFLIMPDEYGGLEVNSFTHVVDETLGDILVSRFEGANTDPFAFLVLNDETEVEINDGEVRFGVTNDPNLPTFLLDLSLKIPGTVDGVGVEFLFTQKMSAVNQSFVVQAPTLYQMSGLSEDLPSYPKAYNTTGSEGKIYFNSDDSVEDVAIFFDEALFSKGWEKIDEKGSVTATPLFSYYAKEDDNLAVIVNKGQDGVGSETWVERQVP